MTSQERPFNMICRVSWDAAASGGVKKRGSFQLNGSIKNIMPENSGYWLAAKYLLPQYWPRISFWEVGVGPFAAFPFHTQEVLMNTFRLDFAHLH